MRLAPPARVVEGDEHRGDPGERRLTISLIDSSRTPGGSSGEKIQFASDR